jgi:pilus assembly protein Flp/PilA
MSMRGFREVLADFLIDEAGATSTEYALIAAGIAVAIIASLNAITAAISQGFGDLATTSN